MGKTLTTLPGGMAHRSTPTRVGKTQHNHNCKRLHKVHPHACGENLHRAKSLLWPQWSTPTRVGKTGKTRLAVLVSIGPPPRVWGKHRGPFFISECYRSTPTRVGKTLVLHVNCQALTVHPHACGENAWVDCLLYHILRSTPTRVGKTFPSWVFWACSSGPPPRVWGKRIPPVSGMDEQRSTPTRVGKTWFNDPIANQLMVHPHACGENAKAGFRGN